MEHISTASPQTEIDLPSLRNQRDLRRALRSLRALKEAGPPPGYRSTSVAVLGNCTLTNLCQSIEAGLLTQGVIASCTEGPYDQWAGELMNPHSVVAHQAPSFVVVYLSMLGLTDGGLQPPKDVLETLISALNGYLERSGSRIILVLPEPLAEEADPALPHARWRHGVMCSLRNGLDGRIWLLDPASTLASVGAGIWFAPRLWFAAKIPAHPDALLRLGDEIALMIARMMFPQVKVVACDMDNTLWGGVVGEDGWEGIELDPHEAGAAYLRLQAYLKHLSQQGILLAAISKNNEADVREVFEKRREMILSWEDFAVTKVNWQPKSANLREAIASLNLGLDSVVFLDDAAFERAEVRQALPDVMVPELPTSPDEYVPFLLEQRLFWTPPATAEDLARSRMYRDEARRRQAQANSTDYGSFLRSLSLRMAARPIGADTLERAVRLINKTNQFNLTVRRHDSTTVLGLAQDETVYCHVFETSDAFGNSGVTGVLIAVPDGNSYAIDTWLLSCRVMGRTFETAMFIHLLDWLRCRDATRLNATYRPAPKNKPVADLLPRMGFVPLAMPETDGSCRYCFDVTGRWPDNSYVALTEAVEVA